MIVGQIVLTLILLLFFVGTGCITWDLILEFRQNINHHNPTQSSAIKKPADNRGGLILDEILIDSLLGLQEQDMKELVSVIIDDDM